jgi:hypothetical protein
MIEDDAHCLKMRERHRQKQILTEDNWQIGKKMFKFGRTSIYNTNRFRNL